MSEGRGLLTESEREAIAGERSDSYRYKTRNYVRSRLEQLETDIEVLESHAPELLDELRATVCESGRERGESAVQDDTVDTTAKDDERQDDTIAPRDDAVAGEGARERSEGPVNTDKLPNTVNFDDAAAAVGAARDYIRDHNGATKADLVKQVMPDHPLGYDAGDAIDKIDSDDRYRGAWWRRVVIPGLKAADDVESPEKGGSVWQYDGDDVDT
jgi:hypothetical protein